MQIELRFVIVSKVVHPWFEEVHRGAVAQAEFLRAQLGIAIAVDYLPPATADVVAQNSLPERCAPPRRTGSLLIPWIQ